VVGPLGELERAYYADKGVALMTAQASSILETTLKQDRVILVAGLLAVIVVSWVWLLFGAGMSMDAFEMTQMSKPVGLSSDTDMTGQDSTMTAMPVAMVQSVEWTIKYALLMFSMWWVMMIAMMLPSASPMLLLFARLNRKEVSRGRPVVPTRIFAAGYLMVWGLFSAFAATLQWAFEASGLLSSMMVSTSSVLGGFLLIAAGAWQLTPIKQACLRHCQSPIGFLASHWRNGRSGAVRMGLQHGMYCLGCCWFLMGLLFYGGVMNLYWIIGLATFVLIEKLSPAGHWVSKAVGIAVLGWGGLVIAGNL
jgi:predicted metal-binding membrane protein